MLGALILSYKQWRGVKDADGGKRSPARVFFLGRSPRVLLATEGEVTKGKLKGPGMVEVSTVCGCLSNVATVKDGDVSHSRPKFIATNETVHTECLRVNNAAAEMGEGARASLRCVDCIVAINSIGAKAKTIFVRIDEGGKGGEARYCDRCVT